MGIKIEYMPFPDVLRQTQAWQYRILGILCFNESNPDNINKIPQVHLDTPALSVIKHSMHQMRCCRLGRPY